MDLMLCSLIFCIRTGECPLTNAEITLLYGNDEFRVIKKLTCLTKKLWLKIFTSAAGFVRQNLLTFAG